MNTANVSVQAQPKELFTSQTFSAEEKRRIDLIQTHDLSLIREKMLKDNALPASIVDEAILEYRKYMTLLRLGFQKLAMCSREVDEVWHTHILFTQNYATFCDHVFDGFVHHDPVTSPIPVNELSDTTEAFLGAYRKVFGEPSQLWGSCSVTGIPICQPTIKGANLCQPTIKSAALCQPTIKSAALCQPTVAS
jgi:hypothetical protein